MARYLLDLSDGGRHSGADDPINVCHRIDELVLRVDLLWRDAMAAGDFVEIERLTSASQALHRAALALRATALVIG